MIIQGAGGGLDPISPPLAPPMRLLYTSDCILKLFQCFLSALSMLHVTFCGVSELEWEDFIKVRDQHQHTMLDLGVDFKLFRFDF